MYAHFETIEEISQRAEKNYRLNESLKTMRAEMKAFNMTLFAYKNSKTYILKAYDEVNGKLDD